jgi:hypothetical protein
MQTPLNIDIGCKVLITVDNWFFAPDGRQYRAVFGTLKAIRTALDSLGFNPGPRSATWYVEVGRVTIAGCQVHYAVRTDECNLLQAMDYTTSAEHGFKQFERQSHIFAAD